MNRPNYPYWRRRYFSPYNNWGWPSYYNNMDLVNSQYSNVAQSIYNAGYMDGVTQSSVVNQTQNQNIGGWW